MLEGFERTRIETSGATINVAYGGSGPAVLLLHGYPQTHAMWHQVAPRLAEELTVVVPDLRGYGDSSKPPEGESHAGYSKRETGRDQAEVMTALGHERFALVGHDRGARVAHRLALDHADRVTRLGILDIVPTHKVFSNVTKELATGYFHWFFLIQPFDLPERMIGADPDYWLGRMLGAWSAEGSIFAPEALEEYRRCFRDPATIHASCEDYRAAATIDLEHDEADLDRKVECPLLALWGARGLNDRLYDVLAAWRERATDVRGRALDCGHFLPEEAPEETTAELLAFLREV